MSTVTTSKGFIRVDGIQTGWDVSKEDGEWSLHDFDGATVFTAATKRECLAHYTMWYTN